MRITLNLATRPYANLGPAMKRLRIAMAVLAVLCIGLLLGLHALHRKAEAARAKEHGLDAAIARINGERQGYQVLMQQPENAQFMSEVAMLNQLFGEKAFSWTLAMENLETVLPGGVQVTQLEPVRAKNGQTTLHLRVLGPHDLSIDLVRNLEHSKRFMLPRIIGENAESSSGPSHQLEPVSASNRFEFDLLADYIPPTPEERARAKHMEKQPAAASEETGNRTGPERRVPGFGQKPGRAPYTGPSGYPAPKQGGPQ
jgi:type IV pilus assembly protein PilN